MSSKTIQGFVKKMKRVRGSELPAPRSLAESFIKHFNIKHPLSFETIKEICDDSGINVEPTTDSGKLRGANCSYKGSILIYYRSSDAPVSRVHTVLHELYEVIEQDLSGRPVSKLKLRKEIDFEADEFASNIQVPFKEVKKWIKQNGVDLLSLRRHFDCSYASAMFRLADVLCKINLPRKREKLPIIFLLYERELVRGKRYKKIPKLKLKFYKKTMGFPFRMRKHEVESAEIEIENKRKKLRSFVSLEREILLKNVPFHFNGTAISTNILAQTIIWPSIHSSRPAKLLIQIVPERFEVLNKILETTKN